jgi:hypothetical protein
MASRFKINHKSGVETSQVAWQSFPVINIASHVILEKPTCHLIIEPSFTATSSKSARFQALLRPDQFCLGDQ